MLSTILTSVTDPITMLIVFLGTLLGIVVGCIPGLNGAIAVSVLLPITFQMDSAQGLLLLGGIYMGSCYGGSISAILLNCPGAAEASCTVLDGYPMAKKGQATKALQYSALASTFGGAIGVLAMILLTPQLSALALRFGPPEMFMLAIIGLTIVGGLSGSRLSLGLFSVCCGIMLALVGVDIDTGMKRYTFDIGSLRAGIHIIPVVVGMFAIAEMVTLMTSESGRVVDVNLEKHSTIKSIKDLLTHYLKTMLRATGLGVLIGVVPGAGGAVSGFMAYGDAKRNSKSPETFGSGNPEGVVAAESANNAAVGGSLIPLLTLGIPGSATAAIMYGALTMHNIIPGPNLLRNSAEFAYTFMGGMFFSVIFMGIIGVFCVGLFAKFSRSKTSIIIPIILVFTILGVYATRNSMLDVWSALACAFLGLIFKKLHIPAAPLLLGHILALMLEQNLRRTMTLADSAGENVIFFICSRPATLVFIAILPLIFYKQIKALFFKNTQKQKA